MSHTTTVSQTQPFAMIPSAVVYNSELHHADIRVYAALADRAGSKRHAWPSLTRLSEDLNMSRSTIVAALKRLEAAHVIVVERNGRKVNHYHLPSSITEPTSTTIEPAGTTIEPDAGTTIEPELEEVRTRPIEVYATSNNDVWDALNELFGAPTTKTNQTLRGKITKSLQQAAATRQQILIRAQFWPLHFPDTTLTESALEKHWDRLARPPLRADTQDAERAARRLRMLTGGNE
jgi:DNA-binding Lrp family transcriptional regulator